MTTRTEFRERALATYREIVDTRWPLATARSVEIAQRQIALLEAEQELIDWERVEP